VFQSVSEKQSTPGKCELYTDLHNSVTGPEYVRLCLNLGAPVEYVQRAGPSASVSAADSGQIAGGALAFTRCLDFAFCTNTNIVTACRSSRQKSAMFALVPAGDN
jgi:hypothetical protein